RAPSFEPCDLGGHECGAALEILRTVPGPNGELCMMSRDSGYVLRLAQRRAVAARSASQRGVEVGVGGFNLRGVCPQQLFSPGSRFDRVREIASQEARLQLTNPVPARRQCETGMACQVVFEETLVEPFVVEAAERRRQAA